MSRAVTVAGYAVLVTAAVVLELTARRRGGPATFGHTLAHALRRWPVRATVLAAWLWLGWHLFVRVDWH